MTLAIDIHFIDGNSAAVVNDRDGIIEMNGDIDFAGISGESFVDRIVHDLKDTMVETPFMGVADVHVGAFSHALQPLQFLNLGGVICLGSQLGMCELGRVGFVSHER